MKKLILIIHFFLLPIFCFPNSHILINHPSNACELSITKMIVGDCEYGPRTGNVSKVIVAVFLEWKDAPPGSKIEVTLKNEKEIIDPFEKGCPPYVQFIVTPDGSNYTVQAKFTSGACPMASKTINSPNPCDPPVCNGPNTVGGKVYRDFNGDGIQDASETGFEGIEVRLFDDNEVLRGNTISKTNGIWAVAGLPPGLKLRAEYKIPEGLFDSNQGSTNKTRTQFTQTGKCDVNLGIVQIQKIIDPDPWMVTSCFSKGRIDQTNFPAYNEPTLVANKYSTTSGGPRSGPNGNYYIASSGETGSVWGIAFQKETKQLFSSAFLKRQCALGPGGLGAIYVTDLTSFLPNPAPNAGFKYYGKTNVLINLDNFGINTGDESLLVRDIPISPFDGSHDAIAFDMVGKNGLGDLEINDTGDTLFTVNLFNQSLITINIGNPLGNILPEQVKEIPIPDPGCPVKSDWRPWGLKFHNGKLYVGGVCSGESTKNINDMKGVVYTFNKNGFSKIVSMDLNYIKGFLNGDYCGTFKPWNKDFYYYKVNFEVTCGPVTILSDIEFDSENNMILSYGDRFGHQSGGKDFGTNPSDKMAYIAFGGGDLIKLFNLKGEFLIEKNATSGFFTTPGKNNNQGICGGEFYYQDAFFGHQESTLGSVAVHPSYNTVHATLMDPDNIWSNGWSQLDNSNGSKKVNYNVYSGENGTFGKAAGLGDIELLIGSSFENGLGISIGNLVWMDADKDGIQDPGEIPLKDIPVQLYDDAGNKLQMTKTNSEGIYNFENLDENKIFYIQLGEASSYNNNNLMEINGTQYRITAFQSRKGTGNKENDSDANQNIITPVIFNKKIVFNYKTGKNGENDFSLDFGLIDCTTLATTNISPKICINDSLKIGITWVNAKNPNQTIVLENASKFGCDSTVIVEAVILQTSASFIDTILCIGEQLKIGDKIFNASALNGISVLHNQNKNGCDSIVSVNIRYPDYRIELDTGLNICYGDTVLLDPKYPASFNNFIWSPARDLSCADCPETFSYTLDSKTYWLTAQDEYDCTYREKIRINVNLIKDIHFPNIISRKSIGNNDRFTLYGGKFLERIEELKVYDRWGNLIAMLEDLPPNDPSFGWDGTFNDKEIVPGVYVFISKVRYKDKSTRVVYGDVTSIE